MSVTEISSSSPSSFPTHPARPTLAMSAIINNATILFKYILSLAFASLQNNYKIAKYSIDKTIESIPVVLVSRRQKTISTGG